MGAVVQLIGQMAVAVASAVLATTAALSPTPAVAAPVVEAKSAAAAQDTLRIMPLGDSITYGVGTDARNSYRSDLWNRLTAGGLPIDYVGSQQTGTLLDADNEGHPGWTSAQLTAHIDGWLTAYQPDVVLLHAGTNDIRHGLSPEQAVQDVATLVGRIQQQRPNTEIFVAKIVLAKRAAEKSLDARLNLLIPGVIGNMGTRVHIVDQSSVSGLDLLDLNHPNDVGYRKMAWNWFQAMRRVYLAEATTSSGGVNPYMARQAYRCLKHTVVRYGTASWATDCRTWYLRTVTTAYGGSGQVWQYPVTSAVKYWAAVGRTHQLRTRAVTRWYGPAQFLKL